MRITKVPSSYSEEQLQQYLERIQWKGEAPQPTLEDLYVLLFCKLAWFML